MFQSGDTLWEIFFCVTAGNAELLPNGGWFIGYGVQNQQFVKRNAVEVHPDGSIALELSLPDGVLAYRITKLPWKETINEQSFTHYEVREGNTYSFNNESITTGVEIEYSYLVSPDYNESKITRVPYAPVYPEFTENINSVYPVSIIYEVFAIDSQTSELLIDLAVYPEIKDPENTIVYYRNYTGQGLFIPLLTIYSTSGKLITNLSAGGEIAFGIPGSSGSVNIPILYEPINQQEVITKDTIILRWTGKGMYNSFNIQISTDSTFSTILQESSSNLSDFEAINLASNTKYYWRVNSVLGAQTSQWSDVWNFDIVDDNTIVAEYENKGYNLSTNYPNPFNQSTTISYSIQQPFYVTLNVYDYLGKKLRTLVSENQQTGIHSINFDAQDLPQGIYFYSLKLGNHFVETKKMVLMKK